MDIFDPESHIGELKQQLEDAENSGDPKQIHSALDDLAFAYENIGEFETAIEYYEQQLENAVESDHLYGRYDAHADIGRLHAQTEQLSEAMGHFETALELAREMEDPREICQQSHHIGQVHTDLEHPQKATHYFQQAIETARDAEDTWAECVAIGEIALALYDLKRRDSARQHTEESLEMALEEEYTDQIALRAADLAIFYGDTDKYEEAIALNAFAFDRLRELQHEDADGALTYLTLYRETIAETVYTTAIEEAEDIVAEIFAEIGGEEAAELARPLDISPEDISEVPPLPEDVFNDVPEYELRHMAQMAGEEDNFTVRTTIVAAIAREYLQRGMHEPAGDIAAEAIDDGTDSANPGDLSILYTVQGVALGGLGEIEQAIDVLRKGMEAAEKAGDEETQGIIADIIKNMERAGGNSDA